MPFVSGSSTKVRENVVLSPGSFAASSLSVCCSVATAVGMKLKEVFENVASQSAYPDWIIICCQKEQFSCLRSANVPNKPISTWVFLKLCCESDQLPQLGWKLAFGLLSLLIWLLCSYEISGAGARWESGGRTGYPKLWAGQKVRSIPSSGSALSCGLKVTAALSWKYSAEALWAWQSKKTWHKCAWAGVGLELAWGTVVLCSVLWRRLTLSSSHGFNRTVLTVKGMLFPLHMQMY